MEYVENGVPEDFAKLCFKGMTIPLCELTEEEYMQVVFGVEGYKAKPKRGGGYRLEPVIIEPKNEASIEELELSQRPGNCLKRAGIETINELCELSEMQLKQIRNMGDKSVKEIKEALARLGLALRHE